VHDRHQEPARGGAEGLDSGVARPGSDLRQIAWNAELRSKERGWHCSRMSLPQGDQAGSVAQNAGFGPRAGPKFDMATSRQVTLKSDACFHLTKRSSVARTPGIGPRYAPLMRQLSGVRTRLTWSSACGPRVLCSYRLLRR